LKAVVQRASSARVRVDGAVVREIDRGICILLGIAEGDDEATAARLAGKTARLRIFENQEGKFRRCWRFSERPRRTELQRERSPNS
jgi:D-tyrosyl-tRNA(Tyr) deacylase